MICLTVGLWVVSMGGELIDLLDAKKVASLVAMLAARIVNSRAHL